VNLAGAGDVAWRRPGIRSLLLAWGAFTLAMPILAILLLRLFDAQLIQRTEAQLIAQAVLVAETWREAWLTELGIPSGDAPRFAPDAAGREPYWPIEPMLRLDQGVLPAAPEATRMATDRSGPGWRAGATIEPILRRAVRSNLASVRVLDADGCVVASSGDELGACLDLLPEVRTALAGRYSAVLRERIPESSVQPTSDSISRRSRVRVHIAIPVLSQGEVIGVVRMTRTALDPAKALWFDRWRLLMAVAACTGVTAILSLFLGHTLSRPLRRITHKARDVARGESGEPFRAPKLAARELHEMNEAVARMTEQLSSRAEYVSEFAANVSHELKTPIAAIRGAGELLAGQWRDMTDEERDRFLSNIAADADRMGQLVSRLLELARIETAAEGAVELDPALFLNELCASYGSGVRVRLGPLPPRLRIHGDHLESALRNLIENALRHGAGHPVDVHAEGRADGVCIRVRDRGRGISVANADRIFDRFFTTERDRGGTGLGLPIARAVAERRGGRLAFESGPQGTCFELVI
jgi:signal transduction histidine kinase